MSNASDTRHGFQRGNTAARTHGLQSQSRLDLRRRNARVNKWSKRLVLAMADAGMPLSSPSLPLATKWAELETLRVDYYALIQQDVTSKNASEMYLATARLQVAVERELGMTPLVIHMLRPDKNPHLHLAKSAQAKLLSLYGREDGDQVEGDQ